MAQTYVFQFPFTVDMAQRLVAYNERLFASMGPLEAGTTLSELPFQETFTVEELREYDELAHVSYAAQLAEEWKPKNEWFQRLGPAERAEWKFRLLYRGLQLAYEQLSTNESQQWRTRGEGTQKGREYVKIGERAARGTAARLADLVTHQDTRQLAGAIARDHARRLARGLTLDDAKQKKSDDEHKRRVVSLDTKVEVQGGRKVSLLEKLAADNSPGDLPSVPAAARAKAAAFVHHVKAIATPAQRAIIRALCYQRNPIHGGDLAYGALAAVARALDKDEGTIRKQLHDLRARVAAEKPPEEAANSSEYALADVLYELDRCPVIPKTLRENGCEPPRLRDFGVHRKFKIRPAGERLSRHHDLMIPEREREVANWLGFALEQWTSGRPVMVMDSEGKRRKIYLNNNYVPKSNPLEWIPERYRDKDGIEVATRQKKGKRRKYVRPGFDLEKYYDEVLTPRWPLRVRQIGGGWGGWVDLRTATVHMVTPELRPQKRDRRSLPVILTSSRALATSWDTYRDEWLGIVQSSDE